ncbi:hypothetical protein ACVWZK_003461 [Bradyrhizobium sp. GM0.4]
MPATRLSTAGICIALGLALLAGTAEAQTAPPTRDDIVGKLNHFEQAAEIDLPALKLQVMERAKARIKNDPGPVNRPLIAPDLVNLPTFTAQIQFDADTPIIQPAVLPDRRPPRRCAGPCLAAALHVPDRRPCRIQREDARGQRDPEPAPGGRDTRRAGEHVQDLDQAAASDRPRRGAVSRPGQADLSRQRPVANPDLRQGTGGSACASGCDTCACSEKARQEALSGRATASDATL